MQNLVPKWRRYHAFPAKMTLTDLRALNVVLWENLLLVVVLVLESNGPYCLKRERDICIKPILGREKRLSGLPPPKDELLEKSKIEPTLS